MDPGGFVNYILNRPTAAPFATVTVGDYGGDSGYIHADLGGPIDHGRFGGRPFQL
jgi:iron complex outermembrane receptor protein